MNDDAALTPNQSIPPTGTIPPAEPSALRKIFIGKDGLRAGSSLLIFIAIFVAIIVCVNVIGHKLHPPAPKTAKTTSEIPVTPSLSIDGVIFLVILLVTWIMSNIERRPLSVYGLGIGRKFVQFFSGWAWGVACLSLLVLTLWKTGLLVIDSRLLFGRDILRYGTFWLLSFLQVGLLEEYHTRGYLQYTLARGLAGVYQWAFKTRHSMALGFWTAAVIFSIRFGLGHSHNPGESPSDYSPPVWPPWSSA